MGQIDATKSVAEIFLVEPPNSLNLLLQKFIKFFQISSSELNATWALQAFAKKKGATGGQISLAWVIAQGEHIIPIPGTRYAKNVRENAAAADIVLSEEDLAELERLLPAGFAHGDRYSVAQYVGPERYC